jgi:hypothetical protein
MKGNTLNKQGLSITINEGKQGISTGTVRFDWKLEPILCALKPEYILVVVSDRYTTEDQYSGRRFIVKVSDGHMYMQFYRSKQHRINFFLLNPLTVLKPVTQKWIKETSRLTGGNFSYESPLYQSEMKEYVESSTSTCTVQNGLSDKVLCAIGFEIEIPENVFAKKGSSYIPDFVTNFIAQVVNTGYRHKVIDECDYRKRKLISFLTPHFYVIWILRLILLIITAVQMVVLSLLRIVALFIGFMPRNIFAGWKQLFQSQILKGRTMFKDYFSGLFQPLVSDEFSITELSGDTFRVYDTEFIVIGIDHHYENKVKKVPITPLAIVMIMLSTWLVVDGWKEHSFGVIFLTFLFTAYIAIAVSTILFRIMKPITNENNWYFWTGYVSNPWLHKEDLKSNDSDRFRFIIMIVSPLVILYAKYFTRINYAVITFISAHWIGLLKFIAYTGLSITVIVLLIRYRAAIRKVLPNLRPLFSKGRVFRTLMKVFIGAYAIYAFYILFFSPQIYSTVKTGHPWMYSFLCMLGFFAFLYILGLIKKHPLIVVWIQKQEETKRQKESIRLELAGEQRKLALERFRAQQNLTSEKSQVLIDQDACEECNHQTVTDKFRLVFYDLKAKMCKPYEQ